MAGLVQTVAPESEPVSRSEAILYARWEEGTDEDSLFDALIAVAREQTETITEHQLNTATYVEYFDHWQQCYLLSKPPLQSVTRVSYVDTDGVLQTVAASDYNVNTEDQHRGNVIFDREYEFPELNRDQLTNLIEIEFVAGYEAWPPAGPASVQGVPETLKLAMKLWIDEMWSHREYQLDGKVTGTIQQNKAAMQILKSYRVVTPIGMGISSDVPQYIR